MLSKPILHNRIGKWALALTKFSLTFKPLRAMKGQIVANFIVGHAMVESSLNVVDTKPWRLYFDGSSHKDKIRVGVLILSPHDGLNRVPFKLCLIKFRLNLKVNILSKVKVLDKLGKEGLKLDEILDH